MVPAVAGQSFWLGLSPSSVHFLCSICASCSRAGGASSGRAELVDAELLLSFSACCVCDSVLGTEMVPAAASFWVLTYLSESGSCLLKLTRAGRAQHESVLSASATLNRCICAGHENGACWGKAELLVDFFLFCSFTAPLLATKIIKCASCCRAELLDTNKFNKVVCCICHCAGHERAAAREPFYFDFSICSLPCRSHIVPAAAVQSFWTWNYSATFLLAGCCSSAKSVLDMKIVPDAAGQSFWTWSFSTGFCVFFVKC